MLRVAMISVHTCPLARLGSRETGGMNVYVRELSRQLGARGVAVDVFTRRQDPLTPEVVEFGHNVRVIHVEAGPALPMDKYRVAEYLPQFDHGVVRFQERSGGSYRMVHSHYWLSAEVAMRLSRRWNTPLISMFHTLGHFKNRVSTSNLEREQVARIEVERRNMAAANRLIAASPTDLEQMVDYYGAEPSRVRVVPGGVDTAVFFPRSSRQARSALGWGAGMQLLFVGRIQQLKGIDVLIQAFARLLEGWVGSRKPRLVVVGGRNPADPFDPEAMEMARLRELTLELGIAGEIAFQGAVPHTQLPLYYSSADVVVVPSTYESFGLVALEAMACGAPVVASEVGGLQWTVRHGETGLLVGEHTPERFASAIQSLLENGRLRAGMSRRAVEVAREFSWDVAAERTVQVYGELLRCPAEPLLCS